MENQKELALTRMYEDDSFVAELTSSRSAYSSMTAETVQDKAKLFRAMNDPDKRLADCINMTINAKDLYCEVVTCVNHETGEAKECPRIVIIDDKGVSYQAVSLGIYSAFRKLIQLFGEPTWSTPIPVMVKQITKGARRMLTLELKA